MAIILVDIDAELVEAWQEVFQDVPDVTIHHGSIEEVACDAIVSPANSFGFMDGGVDLAISQCLGWHVSERLQEIIARRHHGELPVGKAEIVPTDHPKVPWLFSAPTMRTPMVIADTRNAYLATKAVMDLWREGKLEDGRLVREVIKTVAFPGMGTGCGQLPPAACARQMREAILAGGRDLG